MLTSPHLFYSCILVLIILFSNAFTNGDGMHLVVNPTDKCTYVIGNTIICGGQIN